MSNLFISCDWGTTRLRVRAARRADAAIAATWDADAGVAAIAASYAGDARAARYAKILAAGIDGLANQLPGELADAPIVISGMASSSIGWQELPYAELPLPLDGSTLVVRALAPFRSRVGTHRLWLVSGVRTAHDVMRGEETELAGLGALCVAPQLASAALVIKPGTHAKHVWVEASTVTGFSTFMSGELFEVLARHSVLVHSLAEAVGGVADPATEADFRAGVRVGRDLPLAAALFQVRTRGVLAGRTGSQNRAFLSGVLLGSELGYLDASALAGRALVLCATDPLAAPYRTALDELGHAARLAAVPAGQAELASVFGQARLLPRLLASP